MVDIKNNNQKIWKIILGGSGGQGIITLGRVLAYTGVSAKLNVTFLPAYGAEMRGGYVYSMLSFSSKELVSPVISQADYGVFLNENSLQMLNQYLKEKSWILWNSSLIKNRLELKQNDIGIPASEIAEKLGTIKVANMVMLGGLLKLMEKSGFPVKEKNIISALKETINDGKSLSINLQAVSEGKRIIEEVL
ncbi:MAG: 2-oxoacid:acceptor oxidoreductase family protein [Candidatus Omnitrophica bacterium]|nr:2-oxoacid:acceptor oxidoreductase family protein [Candidatus Omnitrophota bacterium]